MSSDNTVTVYKLDHNGREVWQYPARILERRSGYIRLEAFFNRDDTDLGYTIFKRNDRFVETFYMARWFNVFAVYDRDDGMLKGWYCNICRPAEIGEAVVRSDDLALDVWVGPDIAPVVLDEDEFAALDITENDRANARAGLMELLELVKSGRLPF